MILPVPAVTQPEQLVVLIIVLVFVIGALAWITQTFANRLLHQIDKLQEDLNALEAEHQGAYSIFSTKGDHERLEQRVARAEDRCYEASHRAHPGGA